MFKPHTILKLGPHFWQKLYCFYHVAFFRSLSKAATYLEVDKGSLSRSLQALEYRLNQGLIQREVEPWALTEAGWQLFKATEILLETLKTVETLLSTKSAPTVELPLSIPEWLLCDYWAEALHQWKAYERVPLRLKTATDTLCTVRVELESSALSLEPSWIKKPLGSIRSGLYASPSYCNHHGRPFKKEQLAQHRLIACESSDPILRAHLNWHLNSELQPVFTVHERSHLIKLAQGHAGIIAYLHNHPDLKTNGFIEILPEYSLIESPEHPLWFVCSSLDWEEAAIQGLYALLKKGFVR